MKKILVVGMGNKIGGTETYFHNYYKQFDLNKYHFDFITAWGSMAFADEYKKNGSKVFVVPNFMKNPIGYYKKMRKIIREGNYNIIHINMLSAANILPVKAALAEKVPKIIVHSHATDMPKGVLRKILHNKNQHILSNEKLFRVACCEDAGRWLFGPNNGFQVLNNAIDLSKFKYNIQNRNKIRKKYGIKQSDFLLGNVGRISDDKNQIFLINILSLIKDKNVKLMLIGDSISRAKLDKKIESSGLKNRVTILPSTSNIEEFYSAFDLFLFPSKFEGMPLAPVEAQANGLECILPDYLSRCGIFSNQLCLNINKINDWIGAIEEYRMNNDCGTRKKFEKHIQKYGFDISREGSKLDLIYDDYQVKDNEKCKNKIDYIPKIIHYCWFGGSELPELAKKCIESWEKYCPDYKIMRWDESNFDFDSNKFAKDAYKSKKWAFVSDYARLYVLYKYGGVYMDTDMELIRPIDDFLNSEAFSGFESPSNIAAGIIGSKKKSVFIKDFLACYDDDKNMNYNDGQMQKTIVTIMTDLCKKYNLKLDGSFQTTDHFTVYPTEVFYPKSPSTRKIRCTDNTVAIHHYSGSWLTDIQKKRLALRERLYKKYGDKFGWFVYQTVYLPYRIFSHCKDNDMKKTLKRLLLVGEEKG